MPYIRKAVLLLCCSVLVACSDKGPPVNGNGKELFNHYCVECHGLKGKGSFLNGIPANKDSLMSETKIIRMIRYGDPSKPNMPKFPQLSRKEATLITGYLVDQLR